MSFSERRGYKQARTLVQREAMDDALRIGLWNVLDIVLWEDVKGKRTDGSYGQIARVLWINFYKEPIDTIPTYWTHAVKVIRKDFFSRGWNEVYDLVEFMTSLPDRDPTTFTSLCNRVLEKEMSAYRFVGKTITEITSATEIEEVERALVASKPAGGAETHLAASLSLLSDRETPDYRNSIKEAISAVEAVANAVAGTKSVTLGAALKVLKQSIDIHPALEGAFSKMYGYTSDAQGIRHALMDEPNLSFEDAKFMLVSCSAFINYLIAKAAKAGIQL